MDKGMERGCQKKDKKPNASACIATLKKVEFCMACKIEKKTKMNIINVRFQMFSFLYNLS